MRHSSIQDPVVAKDISSNRTLDFDKSLSELGVPSNEIRSSVQNEAFVESFARGEEGLDPDNIRSMIGKARARVTELLEDPGKSDIANGFLAARKNNPALNQVIVQFAHNELQDLLNPGGQRLPAAAAQAVMIKNLPDEIFGELLREYLKDFKRNEMEITSQFEELKERFISRVEEAVAAGKLPQEAQENLAALDGLDLRVSDGIFVGRLGVGNAGSYKARSHRMTLNNLLASQMLSGVSERSLEATFTHELIHVIAGRALIEDDNGKLGGFTRSGVGITNSGGIKRHRWLNEAITETLTELLLEDAYTTNSYEAERELFDKVCEQVPQELFVRAYFQNGDPRLSAQELTQPWRELSESVSRAFERGYLAKLDRFEQENGILQTLNAFSRDPQQFVR